MAAKDASPSLAELEQEAKDFAEDLGRTLRRARRIENAICDAADAGSDVAERARKHVNWMVGHINMAKGHASAGHEELPDISVQFGGGKG